MRWLLLVLLVACGGSERPRGGGGSVVRRDASISDLGPRDDLGRDPNLDASTSDGGQTDADERADLGFADAETLDLGSRDANTGPNYRYCIRSCSQAADCTTGTPIGDADNYRCENRLCVYTGCNSTAECQQALQRQDVVCVAQPNTTLRACLTACSAPADCSLEIPAYDADNYQCHQGGCAYSGCNDTPECQTSFPDHVCADSGFGRFCLKSCRVAADCPATNSDPAYDADNYACVNNVCQYTGCNGGHECPAAHVCASF